MKHKIECYNWAELCRMTEDQFPIRQSSYYYTLEYQKNVSSICYSKLQIEIVLFCYVQTTELDYKNTNSKTEIVSVLQSSNSIETDLKEYATYIFI